MAHWFYFDSNSEKQGPISGRELKALVAESIILPETIVETEGGRRVPAKNITGLTFPASIVTEPQQQNWFYYGVNDYKHGPITEEQLQTLAARRVILPDTIVEGEDGKREYAKNISGLTFPTAADTTASSDFIDGFTEFAAGLASNSSIDNFIESAAADEYSARTQQRQVYSYSSVVRQQLGQQPLSFFGWLFDFGFTEIWCVAIEKMIMRIVYVLGLIAIGSVFFGSTVTIISDSNNHVDPVMKVIIVLGACIVALLAVIYWRLCCEWCIFICDWLVDTQKAAKHIIKDHQEKTDNP
ncbi:MAG: DUF4282 domain-containing protein [Planctomycetaceae bacterium]|jgi:hypothetical protein|nr:DUF4282 domain-containing protein [Planctomycetaceae bacterium]